jgi:hypothetical protein
MSSWWPARAQWRASAPPISPVPITPIFMGFGVGASAAKASVTGSDASSRKIMSRFMKTSRKVRILRQSDAGDSLTQELEWRNPENPRGE